LAIPNFAKLFAIETDACQSGVGAVLLQEGHPLAYVSKPLGPKTQGLSIYKKRISGNPNCNRAMAIVFAAGRVYYLY
jgi:hypothetical protein